MLSPRLVPTRLLAPAAGSAILVARGAAGSRLRTLRIAAALLRYAGVLAWLRLTGGLDARVAGVRLRERFEHLGGLWLKVGQLLSLRIDLFPLGFCQELAILQHSSIGFPAAAARQIVEADLGTSIDHCFDVFDDAPFAVASIGQVHRARLRREGVVVAVKVQKPDAARLFASDLAFVRAFVTALRLVRFWPHMRWDWGYDELRAVMKEEIDFHYEASAMRRMRRTLRRHSIYVPRVFRRYSSRRVLVAEFIDGVPMAEYVQAAENAPDRLAAWCHENRVDPRKVAKRLILSLFRQMLEDNLYHGDLHPGNILLLRDDRVALIDFGATNFTEREYLQKFRLFMLALATRDYAKSADLSLMLTASLPDLDQDAVKDELVRALRSWATRTDVPELPYHDKSIDNAAIEVVRILVSHKCTMEWAWLRIHRALTTLDMSLIHLYSDVNYTKMLQRYFRRAERRRLSALRVPEMIRRLVAAQTVSLDIQERVNEYTLFQGTLVRRQAQVLRGAVSKGSAIWRFLAQLVWTAVIASGLVGGLAFLRQHRGVLPGRWLGPQMGAWVERMPFLDGAAWLLTALAYAYLVWTLVKLRRRLRQGDRGTHERVAAV
jgi:ubiquinone biosynthesis protein